MLMAPDEFDPKACCRKRTCAHTARTEQMNVSHGAQAWINRALAEDEGGGDEPADMWLSVLLTKLQLQAADVDAAIHDAALQVAAIAPQVVRDIASVRAQVEAVRGDMAALMEEVSGVEASSEVSVALLREVLAVKQRMAGVAEMLRQASHWMMRTHPPDPSLRSPRSASPPPLLPPTHPLWHACRSLPATGCRRIASRSS